jgi:thiamine-phosphate pyrophosphorylase
MKVIVITPSSPFENETAVLTRMFECGLNTLHIRKPKMSTREMIAYLEKIPAHFHNRIVLHSHHRLALSLKVKGIHLTRAHLQRSFTYRLLLKWVRMKRPQLTVSTSYHKLASIYEEERNYNYVFLSPIFDTLTQQLHNGFSPHSLRVMLSKKMACVIARGGINSTNVEKAAELGFGGVALNSSLWKKTDPLAEFMRVLDVLEALHIPNE